MACSADRRIDDVLHAAKKTIKSQITSCLGIRRFHLLTVVWVTASCFWSASAAATEVPFMLSQDQPGQGQDIARLEARITELENHGTRDAYNPELGEAYLELAGTLSAVENYTGALANYDLALQVVRVSNGLDSPNQLPILQAQLDCLERLSLWARYDDTLKLMYRISQNYYPVGDAARIEVLNQLAKWQLKAAEEGLLDMVEDRTRLVADLYENEIELIEASDTATVSDYALSSLHLGRAYAGLAMVKIVLNKPVGEYRSLTSNPTLANSHCQTVQLAAGDGSQTCMAAPLPNLNYYRAPESRKEQETVFYLEELRNAILFAAETLDQRRDFSNRDVLMDEFRFLAESYTEIISLTQIN